VFGSSGCETLVISFYTSSFLIENQLSIVFFKQNGVLRGEHPTDIWYSCRVLCLTTPFYIFFKNICVESYNFSLTYRD